MLFLLYLFKDLSFSYACMCMYVCSAHTCVCVHVRVIYRHRCAMLVDAHDWWLRSSSVSLPFILLGQALSVKTRAHVRHQSLQLSCSGDLCLCASQDCNSGSPCYPPSTWIFRIQTLVSSISVTGALTSDPSLQPIFLGSTLYTGW